MSTDRQIEANRLNAQHSTGPSTPEGRAAVRLNGLKYGLYAETLILPSEDPAEFDALLDRLDAEHQPATPTEEIFVSQEAMAIWETKISSVGVAGWCSASSRSSRASNSAGSSLGRMRVSAYKPYLRPLRRTAARPSGVDGPVLCCALRRFASICRSVDMRHLWWSDWFVNSLRFYSNWASGPSTVWSLR